MAGSVQFSRQRTLKDGMYGMETAKLRLSKQEVSKVIISLDV